MLEHIRRDTDESTDAQTGPVRAARRAVLFGVAAAGWAGLGFYARFEPGAELVFAHLAYVPIVLAGLLWGRRGVWAAVCVAAVSLLLRVAAGNAGHAWVEAPRAGILVLVGLGVGELRERLRAVRRALAASERMHKWVIRECYAGIVVCRDERVLFVNERLCEMVGCSPSDLVGAPIWDVFAEDERSRIREALSRREAKALTDVQCESRVRRKDGGVLWVDLVGSQTDYEGCEAVVFNLFDISDRKRAEQKEHELADLARRQEEQLVHSTRLAELGEMSAAIAHELNQPLTGIRNFAKNAIYMLENDLGSPAEVRDNLRLISEQVDRASKIINQVRQLTRRSERQFVPVDVNRTVRENLEFLMPQMRLSGVEVAVSLAQDLPQVTGDRNRLEQVFLNLLTNARQAMEETAERRLRVTTRCERGSDLPVVVEIADTGKGLTEEERAKLFTPFFTTKKPGHGTGLGLPISLAIVKEHNGRIEAGGAPGRGATFTVRLPARPGGDSSKG